MTETNGEIRVRLVADDHTSATVEKVRHNVQGLEGAAHDAGAAMTHGMGAGDSVMKSMHGGALAAAAAVALVAAGMYEAYEGAKMLGEAALEASVAEQKQIKEMTGVLFLIDRGANSMRDIKAYAEGVHTELEETAIAMGLPAKQMDDAFNSLMERGGIASERAKELTVDMAAVGKVTRGGMDGLASGFAMIEMGVVRARNPIVQLISATKILEGNSKAVAAQMMKMTPEKQMEVAQRAIEKQAESLRKQGTGQLSMGAVQESLGGMREVFLKSMGQPMLDALLPPLNRVQKYMVEHIEQVTEWGAKIGREYARVIDAVSAASAGVYDGIVLSWDRVKTSFDQIFGDWVKAWNQATGDTDNIQSSFASMTEDLILAFEFGAKIMKAAAEVAMDINDELHNRHYGTTAAGIQEKALTNTATGAYGAGASADFDNTAAKYRELAKTANMDMGVVDKWIEGMHAAHETNMKDAEAAQQSLGTDHGAYNTFLANSVSMQNEGAEKFAFAMLHGSKDAKASLEEASKHITGGMETMMKLVAGLDPELAKQLKGVQNPLAGKGVTASMNVHNNFTGAISIKQDFRNEDPDRIGVVFRRDLERHATARVTARTGSAFGL